METKANYVLIGFFTLGGAGRDVRLRALVPQHAGYRGAFDLRRRVPGLGRRPAQRLDSGVQRHARRRGRRPAARQDPSQAGAGDALGRQQCADPPRHQCAPRVRRPDRRCFDRAARRRSQLGSCARGRRRSHHGGGRQRDAGSLQRGARAYPQARRAGERGFLVAQVARQHRGVHRITQEQRGSLRSESWLASRA